MSISPINNHIQLALKNLLFQYQDQPRITALLTALVQSVQDLENAVQDLQNLSGLFTAFGQQLDDIGTIVGIERVAGQSDAAYLQDILAEIKINTSDGQPEQVLQTFALFTAVPFVILIEQYPAEVLVESQYVPPDQKTVDMLIQVLDKVLPAGVRPYGIVAFDPTDAFAYDGSLPGGAGYGTTADSSVGGKYPQLFMQDGEFAYATTNPTGTDATGLGYGSAVDPIAGGAYTT